MKREELSLLLDQWLSPADFDDGATNGLQIEGKDQIDSVVCGVSANLALIDAAIAEGADALIVHHGLFWSGGWKRLSGWLADRARKILNRELNLFAYHLPLDAHSELGNNACLAAELGIAENIHPFGTYRGQEIGLAGQLEAEITLGDFAERVVSRVGPIVNLFGDRDRAISKVGVCSGGAPDLLEQAIDEGLDLFLTGEVTEWVKAMAEESGVAFIAAGHHATERFGVRALADRLSNQTELTSTFIDIDNPV